MEKIILSDNQISTFRKMYNDGYSVKDIQEFFGVSNTTFYRICKRNNIVLNRNVYCLHVNNELKEKFRTTFHEKQYVPLENDFRKYRPDTINEKYFDVIDHQDKAYLIGLFLADGNIAGNNKSFIISLQESDKNILDEIRSRIRPSGNIVLHNYNAKNSNWHNQYSFCFSSAHICRALNFYGVVPNKSLVLSFPTNLPSDMYKHLFRGYLDGDGNISNNPREKRVRFVSTKSFCELSKLYIENTLCINCSIRDCRCNDITKELMISGGNQVVRFLDWIYEDANLYIQRKYERYCSFKECYNK